MPAPVTFASPREQVARLRRWNDVGAWGLTAAQFDALPQAPGPVQGRLTAVVLVPHLGTTALSIRLLWSIVAAAHQDELSPTPTTFRLDLPEETVTQPSLSWAVVDFASDGEAARRAKDPWVDVTLAEAIDRETRGVRPAGLEAIAALAVSPTWARRLGTPGVPRIVIPALIEEASGAMPFIFHWQPEGGIEMARVQPGDEFLDGMAVARVLN